MAIVPAAACGLCSDLGVAGRRLWSPPARSRRPIWLSCVGRRGVSKCKQAVGAWRARRRRLARCPPLASRRRQQTPRPAKVDRSARDRIEDSRSGARRSIDGGAERWERLGALGRWPAGMRAYWWRESESVRLNSTASEDRGHGPRMDIPEQVECAHVNKTGTQLATGVLVLVMGLLSSFSLGRHTGFCWGTISFIKIDGDDNMQH